MTEQRLSDILHNNNFCQFAMILSVAMSPKWRRAHPEIPSVRETLEYRLSRLNRGMIQEQLSGIKLDFIKEWTGLFIHIVEADPDLFYTTENMDWFGQVMDGDPGTARATFSMLFAVASTLRTLYTCEQVAEITGEAASTWRNRCAKGDIVGATKIGENGKVWVIPSLSLQAYGVDVPSDLKVDVVQD